MIVYIYLNLLVGLISEWKLFVHPFIFSYHIVFDVLFLFIYFRQNNIQLLSAKFQSWDFIQ